MAPKKGAKGGKKKVADDDEHWEKLASKLSSSPVPPPAEEAEHSESDALPATKAKKSAFESLDYDDVAIDEDDEEGGLMSVINKASKKDKKKKKKGAALIDEDEVPLAEADESVDLAAPRGIVEVGADDWMEEEFGSVKEKKSKKGKSKKDVHKTEKEDGADESLLSTKLEETKLDETIKDDKNVEEEKEEEGEGEREDDDTGATKVLSKKEKEKLKKEKEKAKKKALAAAKKVTLPTNTADEESKSSIPEVVPGEVPEPKVDEVAREEGEDGEEGDADDTSKSKKKKKKKPAAEKVKAEPAPPKSKGGAQMAALRALMEAQKAAAEEAARKEEEERQRIIEEERRAEEEEKMKAEEKARKKEREKMKREQLKKEGKLLTPKQKADKAAAELRLKALMGANNMTVAGLQERTSEDAPKKVVYAKKKPFKKVSPGQNLLAGENENETEDHTATTVPKEGSVIVTKEEEQHVAATGTKDDWDASEDEGKTKEEEDVKDDWDASSSESESEKATSSAAPVVSAPQVKVIVPPVSASAKANGKASASDKASPASKAQAKAPAKPSPAAKSMLPTVKSSDIGKAPTAATVAVPTRGKPPVESSSEEGSSEDEEEEDSDQDSSDDSDSEEDSSEDEHGMTATERQAAARRAAAKERRLAKAAEALAARSKDNMRSPICVILGHVDTGKTKLLDKIRQTNVQEGEAGGITQQIGATYFPMDAIRKKTSILGEADLKEYKLPGLLVIDTPGHESFTNLRTRGSSLCNIAILVVDIMHGLEPQTLESLRLLREGKTPFIVALNKIDRLYGWKAIPDCGFQESLASQPIAVRREFEDRLQKTILAFAEQGLNSLPYYQNKDFARIVSLVPTSAHTGEGVPDMLMLIIKLTQERMTERLMYLSTLECTVLEVKVIEGLGTTIDVVLSNGVLREGDKIVVCGLNGAISTQIRALLTPQPMKELRIKGQYVHHKEVKASLGIKIVAPDLEKAIAGSRLLVVTEDDDEDELREEVMSDLTDLMNSVDKSGRGVCVQASTLGSLEALLEFLRTSKIPVSGINIGPVHRKDVMRAATMLEKAKELAVILCFDVPVDKEAERVADELGIKIFKADIIYHLFDAFKAYNAAIVEAKRVDSAPKAVWPCRLKIIACFAKRDPIIVGCDIIEGSLRVGTPICVVRTDPETKKKEIFSLGKVTGLEINHKVKEVVKRTEAGGGVAVKIEHASYESAKQYGRHFDDNDELISMISRNSIDTLKEHFRDDVSKDDWILIKALKVKLEIP